MSNLILDQLMELFPDVSEDFLSGIHDAYKDEEVTIEDLVDIVLSFEFRPPRENSNKLSLNPNNVSSNVPINIKPEVLESAMPSVINNSSVDRPVEDEILQKSVPNETNGDLRSRGQEALLEKSSFVKQSQELDTAVSKEHMMVPSDNNKVMGISCRDNSKMQVKPIPNTELKIVGNPGTKMQCNDVNRSISEIDDSTYSTNQEPSIEEVEDDSSPECSIRFLMGEENLLERYNITTHIEELKEVPDKIMEFESDNNKLGNNSTLLAKNVSSNLALSNGKPTSTKQKKTCRSLKRRICSNLPQNGQASSHCSTKRLTLRSCKVKNEEERLRRRLLNVSRLLHEKQKKNSNDILCSSKFLDLDKKYTLLCNIFTDANPTYLLDQCELLTDQEKILEFIFQNIELRNYPKIETLEESSLIEQFHCTIPKFIEDIPDPGVEFSSPNYVRAGYEENAEIYLKARYNGLSDEEVKQLLRANVYNLTSVCGQLEREGMTPTPGVLDYTPLHHPANVYFHQEVWYIEHRKEVQEYLESAIEAVRVQEELNRPPTPPEEVFECEICRDDIVEYANLGTCNGPTGHLFCKDCIKRSVEVRVGDGETTFPCLVNCGSFIHLQTVEELLPKHVFDKLMGRIQEEEIRKANIAGVETCPFCPYAYGPGEELLFTCLNPHCMKLSCRVCRKEDHSPEGCKMFKDEDEERARHIIENRMAEALMRTCYSCGKNFVKTGGCNKMACTCGAKMCYVCRQPVQDYSHFNGPGGDNTGRCPLFSQDEELHDRPVEATAQQVFNEIQANNPHLNLDRAKLVPK